MTHAGWLESGDRLLEFGPEFNHPDAAELHRSCAFRAGLPPSGRSSHGVQHLLFQPSVGHWLDAGWLKPGYLIDFGAQNSTSTAGDPPPNQHLRRRELSQEGHRPCCRMPEGRRHLRAFGVRYTAIDVDGAPGSSSSISTRPRRRSTGATPSTSTTRARSAPGEPDQRFPGRP
jgi:hypothetical protein